jgi:hypothetical protein
LGRIADAQSKSNASREQGFRAAAANQFAVFSRLENRMITLRTTGGITLRGAARW